MSTGTSVHCQLLTAVDAPSTCATQLCSIVSLHTITSSAAPPLLHLLCCTSSAAPPLLHLLCCTSARSPHPHRWLPAGSSGRPIDQRSLTLLSEPQEALHLDLASPPGCSGSAQLEVEVAATGGWNAVTWWYELTLFGGVTISTGESLLLLQPGNGALVWPC